MCINFIASDNVEPEKCDKNHEKKIIVFTIVVVNATSLTRS